MNLNLTNHEIETVLYLIDCTIREGRAKGLYVDHYSLLHGKISGQQEVGFTNIVDRLKAEIKRGETPSTAKLQREECLSYARAAALIDRARKEQNND